MEPMKRDGAKTPPEPPELMVKEVAKIFANDEDGHEPNGQITVDCRLHPRISPTQYLRQKKGDYPDHETSDCRF